MTTSTKRCFYYTPSARPGEGIAYYVGRHPGYRMLEAVFIDQWVVPHFEIGGFDRTTGERTPGGRLTDFLHNSLGWLMVDRKVRSLFDDAGIRPNQVQWLPVCIHVEAEAQEGEYSVANVLDMRTAVDTERSTFGKGGGPPIKIVLREEAIRGADIFRIEGRRSSVYFSQRLKLVIDRANLTGIEWESTPVV